MINLIRKIQTCPYTDSYANCVTLNNFKCRISKEPEPGD